MLDDVIVGLGYSVEDDDAMFTKEKEEPKSALKQSILDKIEKGEMTVQAALELLNKKK
jgi:hypothetical protein